MTEGTLARWLKKEGEAIKAGDVIAEIETDKATMEVEAVDEGVLGKILVADGTAGREGERADRGAGGAGRGGAAPRPRRTAPKPAAARSDAGAEAAAAAAPAPARSAQPARRAAAAAAGNGQRACARRGAHLRLAAGAPHGAAGGHRLSALKGSGPNGRIVQGGYRGGARAAAAAGAARRRRAGAAPAAAPAPAGGRARAGRSPRRTRWCRTARCGR